VRVDGGGDLYYIAGMCGRCGRRVQPVTFPKPFPKSSNLHDLQT
jgi:hypothetical protein